LWASNPDAWQAERYRRGEIDQQPGYTDNPLAVFMAWFLPTPLPAGIS
jgi:hypothetical protein